MLVWRAKGRDNNEREFRMLLDVFGGAVRGHLPDVGTALAGAVEEQNQGPVLVGFGPIFRRQEKQVIHLHIGFDAKGFGGEKSGGRTGGWFCHGLSTGEGQKKGGNGGIEEWR